MMITSYFKTSLRSLLRSRLFTFINVVGLASSMSVGLLLVAIALDVIQFDSFHENKDKIYRVTTIDQSQYGSVHLASTSIKAGELIDLEVAGVEKSTMLGHGFGGNFQHDTQAVPLNGFWADDQFFKMFSFEVVKGNPATALYEPNSILITETKARTLFGEEDAIGKTLSRNGQAFVVTAVMKDVTKFSHLQFDVLGSNSTRKSDLANEGRNWGSVYSDYLYVQITEGQFQNVQHNLNTLSDRENPTLANEGRSISFELQPLTSIAVGKSMDNQAGPVLSSSMLWFITGLTIIVFLSSAFNYGNLSAARALRRNREVGIRKINGARRSHVIWQFVVEGMLVAVIALIFSFILFFVLREKFLSLTPRMAELLSLEITPAMIGSFLAVALLTGVAAGLLPGLFYAKVKSIQVIKDVPIVRGLTRRKILTAIQYTFSLVFISATIIMYRQYEHFVSMDLGFRTNNILNIKAQGQQAEAFINEVSALPEVENISRSMLITSIGNNYYTYLKTGQSADSLKAWYNMVDEGYIPTFDFKLLSGQNFRTQRDGSENQVIVNEQVVKRMNIADNDVKAAVGETISIKGEEFEIVAVVEDFHHGTAERAIGPFIIQYKPQNSKFISLKIQSGDLAGTLTKINTVWKKVEPNNPLESAFYDDQLERAYQQYSSMVKVIGYLAFLTIVISSLGLLGMIIYSIETRAREIGIRRVFGAGLGHTVVLLGRGFAVLLLTATALAIPITFFFFDNVVLSDIAYRLPIGFIDLLSGPLAVLAAAAAMITVLTFSVVKSNLSEVFRNQ